MKNWNKFVTLSMQPRKRKPGTGPDKSLCQQAPFQGVQLVIFTVPYALVTYNLVSMRILTCAEVREAERKTIGRPDMSTLVLMRRAGHAVGQFCLSHFKFRSVCAVCGKGNNGGDGIVAAEALRE